MAQEYSRQLADRCKRALDSRAAAGHVANKSAFGYRIERADARSAGKFITVPGESEFVRRMFEQRAAGCSLLQIVKELNGQGLKTRFGNLWSTTTVRAILKNEVYLGRIISGARRFKKGHGLQEIRPREQWIVRDGAHEAIITEALWNAVRSRDSAHKYSHAADAKGRRLYLWTGFLKCKTCGANLTRNAAKNVAYYGCDGGRKSGLRLPCQHRCLVRADGIAQTVGAVLRKQIYSPDWVNEVIQIVRDEVTQILDAQNSVVTPLRASLVRLTQQIENASRRLVHVSEDMQAAFLDELKKLHNERDQVVARISTTESIARVGSVDLDGLESKIRSRLDNLWDVLASSDTEQAREELALHVEKIEVDAGKHAWLYTKSGGLLDGIEGFEGLVPNHEPESQLVLTGADREPSISPRGFERREDYRQRTYKDGREQDSSKTESCQLAPAKNVASDGSDKERTQRGQAGIQPGHESTPIITQREINESRLVPGVAALPPDLAAIVSAWPTLPDAIKAGIAAMVKASGPPDRRGA